MTESKQEIASTDKILVLTQEGKLSKKLNSRLMQLKSKGIEYDVKVISDQNQLDKNVKEVVSAIQDGHYQMVLVDSHVHLPMWDIIDRTLVGSSKAKFYLEGTAENILSREMEFLNFSGALRIDKDNEILFQAAKRESHKSSGFETGVPNSPDTRFNIASVTKMITAVAVIRMAKEKSIELQKSLTEILNMPIRDLIDKNDPLKDLFADFTLHVLLTHTSGLYGGIEEPYFESSMMFFEKLEEFIPWIETFVKDKTLKERRSLGKHEYSNPGYNLLGLAVEAITGESYYNYVKKKVLTPANMTHTVSKVVDANPIYAISHTRKPSGFYLNGKSLSVDQTLDLIAEVTKTEQSPKERTLLEDIQSLLKKVQDLHATIYPRIDELSKNLESKLLANPADFLKLKQEFATEIQKLCSKMRTQFPNLLDTLEQYDRAVNEWFEEHKEWLDKNPDHSTTKNMLLLRELLANLPANISWPFETLESFINHFSIATPAGKWRSTVGDLILFHKALWDPEGPLADCASHLIAHAVNSHPSEKYGYGTVIQGEGHMIAVGHTGKVSGGCSSSFYYPNQKFTVVTLGNDDDSVGLFIAFEAIEKHLVYGPENGVIYLDEKINSKGEELFAQETNLIAKEASENTGVKTKDQTYISSTAKMAKIGLANVSTKPTSEPPLTQNKTNEKQVKSVNDNSLTPSNEDKIDNDQYEVKSSKLHH